ncbi:hypothetical protein HG536_0G02430 [Torulaspora globosa]|uniref:PCI domain-containing protein n=1 Tax=Torulaspora globosa TaxID=48254 RepID=A0A7G3ZLJ6_9SACH|nr:uncharacterized protein HG536_0G02430 [Torulaspora globosa]QLL34382.1 hypothetical protein HG536_0G02430 [Torulaspora globosa]
MMDYSLAQFYQDVSNGAFQVMVVDLDLNGQRIAALQRELQGRPNDGHLMDDKALEEAVESQDFRFNGRGWTRFNIMITSFLQFCRDVDPWSLWRSCDLIFKFYQDLGNCLLNDSYPIDPLVPLFTELTNYVVNLATILDANSVKLNTRPHQFLSHTSAVISKVFNSVKPPRTSEDDVSNGNAVGLPEKQRILLYLVNKLNNLYFRIKSPQLCSNIFKNFKPKAMTSSFAQYPIREQIEYRYLLGRYYLLNHRVTNAFVQLNTAFSQLMLIAMTAGPDSQPQIRRNLSRILRYLVPAGLMLGKSPRIAYLSEIDPSLSEKYASLLHHMRNGNIRALNAWLAHHENSLRRDHLLLILLEKLPMICYRNLIRTVVQTCTIPQNTGKIPYAQIEAAFKLSIGELTPEKIDIHTAIHRPDNVENVLVTLINLGLLRGNCFPMLRLCVVKKTQAIREILPSIQERILATFPLNSEDSWLDD